MHQWLLCGDKLELHKLAVYKKPAVESATLLFLAFSFFQHYDFSTARLL